MNSWKHKKISSVYFFLNCLSEVYDDELNMKFSILILFSYIVNSLMRILRQFAFVYQKIRSVSDQIELKILPKLSSHQNVIRILYKVDPRSSHLCD